MSTLYIFQGNKENSSVKHDPSLAIPYDKEHTPDWLWNKRRRLNNWDCKQVDLTSCEYGSAYQYEACLPHNKYFQSCSTLHSASLGDVPCLIDSLPAASSNTLYQPYLTTQIVHAGTYVRENIHTNENDMLSCPSTATLTPDTSISIKMIHEVTDLHNGASDILDEDCNPDRECVASMSNMTICYGMLCDIQVEILPSLHSLGKCQALRWDGNTTLLHPTDGFEVVRLPSINAKVLQTLSSKASAEFQFLLSPQQRSDQRQNDKSQTLRSKGAVLLDPRLSIILYGPNNMATHVGDWLDNMKMYLQVPGGCNRDVPYMNPHCLASNQESVIYTSQLPSDLTTNEPRIQESSSDLFSSLYSNLVFELAPQPYAIASTLHTHQRQALTFMIEREKGWDLAGTRNDIWKSHVDAFGLKRYKNTVCGVTQIRPPESFQGGIIADEMGLGKTCTMLALIAANPLQCDLFARSSNQVKGTLIVVPVPLLFVWEKQIQEHFRRGCVRHAIFYGPDRHQNANLQDYDIVVTTYNTVALEWKARKAPGSQINSSLLFSIFWHRIILDEAHVIRTKETVCAKSVYALQGERRWCITGTPIQNRLSDIFSLLRFLKVHPYDDIRTFQEQILRPWKSKTDEDALKRLQSILKVIAIRRARTVITLPDRIEYTEEVNFTNEERAIYEKARTGVIEVLNNTICSDQLTSGSMYLNALQRINDLRYICNHGVSPSRRREGSESVDAFGPESHALVDDKLETWSENMYSLCGHCGAELLGEYEDNGQFPLDPGGGISNIPSRACKSCLQYDGLTLSPFTSDHSSGISTPSRSKMPMQPSSKIQALVAQIQRLPLDEKCVVFSYWTSSLDAIEQALKQAQIRFCRYDGQLSRQQRNQVLKGFTNDASLRVFLVSITCGGQGLDLTAANHAYLLEPQWNPMLEEQAMARVHRLGQKKAVRLVRLVMKDTFEENIIKLQRRKRTLADLIVDRSPLKEGSDGKKQLYYLRELVS